MPRPILPLTLVLLALATPARAADYDKYLPNDACLVVAINVKRMLAVPLYQQVVPGEFESDRAQEELKKLGLDPLKDIDQAVLAMGPSSIRKPIIIIQGRFDPAKISARAEELARDSNRLTVHQIGDVKYCEAISKPDFRTWFVAVVDPTTIVIAASQDEIEDALARASGKKPAQLQHARLKSLLEQRDPQLAAELFVSGEMVLGVDAAGQTLEALGIESVHGRFEATDDNFQVSATLTCKQAETARDMNQAIETGLKQLIEGWQEDGCFDIDAMKPVLGTLKSVKTKVNERTIELQAWVHANYLPGTVMYILMNLPEL